MPSLPPVAVVRWRWALPSALVALALALPLGVLLYRGASAGPEVWGRLLDARLPALLGNTLALAALVTVGALGLGLSLAWLVERTDLPGREGIGALLVLPLVISPLVLTIVYLGVFGVQGLLERALRGLGWPARVPNLYGYAGAAFVLVLATYPYVYLLARPALRRLEPTLLEAARCSGAGRWRVATRVALPLLAPALSAGGLLTALYVLSDFEVVAMLRYPTFVTAIYQQLTGWYDFGGAAALGSVLVGLMLLLLAGQHGVLGRRRFTPERVSRRSRPRVPLGPFTAPALGLAYLVLLVAVLVPLGVLLYWVVESGLQPPGPARLWGLRGGEVGTALWHSFSVSAGAATLAVLGALPLGYAALRRPDRLTRACAWAAQAGQALPGVLIALGVLIVILRWWPALYATVGALLLAYLVRFFAHALQAVTSSLAQVPANLEEAGRLLGRAGFQLWRRVTLPLLWPGLVAGWTMVFLNALRELPATLVLRPIGFDTLPVRLWTAASEGFYAQAAPAALVLVALSLPLLVLLLRNGSVR